MNASASSGATAETADNEERHMSATEILKVLPNLKHEERRAIVRRVFELEQERGELEWAAQAADLAFQELDKLEEQDAASKPR
jgi:hypothetical protein